MSKRSPASWATTARGSPWTPTPTLPKRCERMPPTGWGSSSHKPSERRRTGTGSAEGNLPGAPWIFSGMGLVRVKRGMAKMNDMKKCRKRRKTAEIQRFSCARWSEWRDLNSRPLDPQIVREVPKGRFASVWCCLVGKQMLSRTFRSIVSVGPRRRMGQGLGQTRTSAR